MLEKFPIHEGNLYYIRQSFTLNHCVYKIQQPNHTTYALHTGQVFLLLFMRFFLLINF
jgi:hypothetical protein